MRVSTISTMWTRSQISALKLEGEIRTVTGDSFKIFQDRRDIQVGQNWLERINQALDSVTLLIAILTPSFFRSDYCLAEMQHFLEREEKLKRSDLIIPIYYVDVPGLNGNERASNSLFDVIRSRQFYDWRELRFESLDSAQSRRALNRLAVQIRDALDRFAKSSPVEPAKSLRMERANHQGSQTLSRRRRVNRLVLWSKPRKPIMSSIALPASANRRHSWSTAFEARTPLSPRQSQLQTPATAFLSGQGPMKKAWSWTSPSKSSVRESGRKFLFRRLVLTRWRFVRHSAA